VPDASTCTACGDGYSTVGSGTTGTTAAVCTVCAPGYSGTSLFGVSGCESCPVGKFSLTNASTCTDCNVGYTTAGEATGIKHPCTICAPGYYGTSVIGLSGCTSCDFGEYAEGGNYTSRCKKCTAGYTTPGMGTPGSNASACSICAAGFEASVVDGALLCDACPSGKFSRAGSSCIGCAKGSFMVVAMPASNHAVTGICRSCEPGRYAQSPDAMVCHSCESGKYMSRAGSNVPCERCPRGTYAASTGAAACTTCPPGKYASSQSISCLTCEAGFYSGKAAVSCKGCHAGTFSASGASVCTVCAAGKYSTPYAEECTDCSAGRYSAMLASTCEHCPEGSFSTAGASECSACASNAIGSNDGASCDVIVNPCENVQINAGGKGGYGSVDTTLFECEGQSKCCANVCWQQNAADCGNTDHCGCKSGYWTTYRNAA